MNRSHLFDAQLDKHLGRYVAQALMATAFFLVTSLSIEVFLGGYLVASLGATTFIVFAMPSSHPARPRSLLGGYLIGTFWGVTLSLGMQALSPDVPVAPLVQDIVGAVAIGVSLFTMVATNCEHPPAAGLALGYVMSPWVTETPPLVMMAVSMLAVTHYLLRNVLIDLT